jgi:hypothetical protein
MTSKTHALNHLAASLALALALLSIAPVLAGTVAMSKLHHQSRGESFAYKQSDKAFRIGAQG